MARLHLYTVHIDPNAPHPYENAVFLPEGFSWKAFFFGPLWALYHRLWWQAAGLLLIGTILAEITGNLHLSPLGASTVQFGFQAIVGFVAFDLLRWRYQKRGFITADIVASDNPLRAEQRFLERMLPTLRGSEIPS